MHGIGAMNRKHIPIRPPPNTGSYYWTYKHSFGVVLLAVVDANYKFVYVDEVCKVECQIVALCLQKQQSLCSIIAREQYSQHTKSWTIGRRKLSTEYHIHASCWRCLSSEGEHQKLTLWTSWIDKQQKTIQLAIYRLIWARRVVGNSFGILQTGFESSWHL